MFFGTRRELDAKNLVRRAGRYTIQVEYRAALSRAFVAPNLRVLPSRAVDGQPQYIWVGKSGIEYS